MGKRAEGRPDRGGISVLLLSSAVNVSSMGKRAEGRPDRGGISALLLSSAHVAFIESAVRIATERPVPDPQTPEWVRDAVFYLIFPDRFARSLSVPKPGRIDPWGATPTWYGYQGGDLVGVTERLDYLSDLGVN